MRPLAVTAFAFLATCAPRSMAQPPPEVVRVEIEGLQGAKATVVSAALSVIRYFEQDKNTYTLSVLTRLTVPQGTEKRTELADRPTMIRTQDEDGKDLAMPPEKAKRPTPSFRPVEYLMHDWIPPQGVPPNVPFDRRWLGVPGIPLNVVVPLELPLPRRLKVLEAVWPVRVAGEQETTAECDFKAGQSMILGPLKVTVKTAEVHGARGQVHVLCEIAGDQTAATPPPRPKVQLLDANGKALLSGDGVPGHLSYSVVGGKLVSGVLAEWVLPNGVQPARIRCTAPEKVTETKLVLRVKDLPIPALP